jgi:hypothetical protein
LGKKTYRPFNYFSSKKSSNNETFEYEKLTDNEINNAVIKTRPGKESAKNTANRLSPNLSENSGWIVLPNPKTKIKNQQRNNNYRKAQEAIKEAQEWADRRK